MELQNFLQAHNLQIDESVEGIINSDASCLLVQGSVGSGKTLRYLTRIAYLLESGQANENNMLNLVYDIESARNMSTLYEAMFTHEFKPRFVDIFSFAYRIVNAYDHNTQTQRKVYKDMNKFADKILKDLFKITLAPLEIERLLRKVYMCKMRLLRQKDIEQVVFDGVDFPAFYNTYEKLKKNKHIYDKADIIAEALNILMYDKDIVELYRNRYQFFNIDDAQELSYASHMILRILHAQKGCLCAFMNPDVACDVVYDASPEIFKAWHEYYGDMHEVKLTKTYRMNQTICSLAQGFMETDVECVRDETCEVKFKGFSEWKKMYDYALKKAMDEEECAYIYREEALAIPLVEHFKTNGIPVQFSMNLKGFMMHPIVRDFASFVSLFNNPRNMHAFMEVRDRMGLDMSARISSEVDLRLREDTSIDVYQAIMESGYKASGKRLLASYMEEIREVSLQGTLDMVKFVLEKFHYGDYMKKMHYSETNPYLIAVLIFANKYPNPIDFLNVLVGLVNLKSDVDANQHIIALEKTRGRQYSRVCMIDCFNEIYPKYNKDEEEKNSERRLFYMGITRAQNNLEFFTSKNCFGVRMEMSPYIYELHGKNKTESAVVKRSESTSSKARVQDIKRGVNIIHKTLGRGTVRKVHDGMMEVAFADETKTLNIKLCIQNKLIQLVKR